MRLSRTWADRRALDGLGTARATWIIVGLSIAALAGCGAAQEDHGAAAPSDEPATAVAAPEFAPAAAPDDPPRFMIAEAAPEGTAPAEEPSTVGPAMAAPGLPEGAAPLAPRMGVRAGASASPKAMALPPRIPPGPVPLAPSTTPRDGDPSLSAAAPPAGPDPAGGSTPPSDAPWPSAFAPPREAAPPIASAPAAAPKQAATVRVFYATDRAPTYRGEPELSTYLGRFWAAGLAALGTLIAVAVPWIARGQRPARWLVAAGTAATLLLAAAGGASCYLLWTLSPGTLRAYGSERGRLELGACEVSIPATHEPGELEGPSLLRLEFVADPAKHIVVVKAEALPYAAFYDELRARVNASPRRDALVFVHGFNVRFEDAARRTAQIAHDLKFAGAPVCYSWPSQGGLFQYRVDEKNVAWTAVHLRQFLLDLQRESGAERIHLVAHSMGNRALTEALRLIGEQLRADRHAGPVFHQVVLTAPDIDAGYFRDTIAPAITATAERVTLYASSKDRALLVARLLDQAPRAGDSGRELIVLPGLETIDVSEVDLSLLGHAYYGDNQTVLDDIRLLLRTAAPAETRPGLVRHPGPEGRTYWTLERPPSQAARPDSAPPTR